MDMNQQQRTEEVQKKAFEAPVVQRGSRMPLITAGSFDLIIPNP